MARVFPLALVIAGTLIVAGNRGMAAQTPPVPPPPPPPPVVVREQVTALFAPRPLRWDVRGECLVVWPEERGGVEARYELRAGPLAPRVTSGDAGIDLPALEGGQLLLSLAPVEWAAWVRTWEPPGGTGDGPRGFLPTLRVLPADVGAHGRVPSTVAPGAPR